MRIKRVLLINPPDTRPPDMLADKVRIGIVPPLGLAYIAAVLEQQGIEVKILDCVLGQQEGLPYHVEFSSTYVPLPGYPKTLERGNKRYGLSNEEISKSISDYKPDLVGVSCLFSNKALDAHMVCYLAKQVNPEIITVMGGSHPTALPEETLADKNVDHVVLGEGEWILYELINVYKFKGGTPAAQWASPFKCAFDIESLPPPARHLLDMPKYLYSESPHSGLKRVPATTISTSRGCPGRCEFCAIRCTFGDAYRYRSPENVLSEIEHLIDTYKIKELHFEDDNLTAHKKRAVALFKGIIDRKLDLSLNSPSGLAVFALDEELLDLMREAGYYSISLAIESGVPEVLKLMRKKVDLIKAERLIRHARSIGMKTKAFFILGYPGETKDTMKRTVDYAGELGADWCLFFPATPLPGTDMLKRCQQNSWLVDPNMDYRRYFFTPNIRTPEFDPEFVLWMKESANRQINFEQNINLREGKFDRAKEDLQEVVKHYPNLDYAQEALRRASDNVA